MTKKIIVEIKNNQIQKFPDKGFGELQVIEQNGEFYFIAREVAKILGYADKSNITKMIKMMTAMMTKTLDKNEKMFVNLELPDRTYKRILICESGLYRLINKSSNSNAKEFKKWIISEELPKIFNRYFNTSGAQSKQLINVSQMANIIRDEGIKIVCKGSGRNKLFEWLIEYGLCIKQGNSNLPTYYAKRFGLMESKENIRNNIDCPITLITSKGEKYILNRFLKDKKATTA